ncbi:MAG: VPDSG-CTERM sorting domain-containing protein [Verrucomicrobia bacterium]|nr:VPDSG-CTERM sorting domain-containing protein [Verrucomicrobiota bacterium]
MPDSGSSLLLLGIGIACLFASAISGYYRRPLRLRPRLE